MLQREHSAILLTFIKLPVVIKTFVLSIFDLPLYTSLTAYPILKTEHSGSVVECLDLRLRDGWFEPHRRHYLVSFSKTLYPLLSTG